MKAIGFIYLHGCGTTPAIKWIFIFAILLFRFPDSHCQNIGIGTSNPGQQLEVAGNIKLGDNIMVEGMPSFRIYRNLASYANDNDQVAGAFVIHTNQPYNNSEWAVTIKGYLFEPFGLFDVTIGGYDGAQGYNWWGDYKLAVRVGYDSGGKLVIILGNPNTAYSYPKISVSEFRQSYNNIDEAFADGWTITQESNMNPYFSLLQVTDVSDVQWKENSTGLYYIDGYVSIGTSSRAPCAALDIASTSKGLLPPRMTYAQRNAISSPVAGLIIFCTDCEAYGDLEVYNGTFWSSLTVASGCGTYILNHDPAGNVAPVTKTVTYRTVKNIPGEPTKCWITQNLGSTNQATSKIDNTEAAAGWFWQFNRMQGYKWELGPTPDWNPMDIDENSNWLPANDPCTLELGSGWRLPTHTEWTNVDSIGGWTNPDGAWNSELKLHAAGYLTGLYLAESGIGGYYWSNTQSDNYSGTMLHFWGGQCGTNINILKVGYLPVRCLRE